MATKGMKKADAKLSSAHEVIKLKGTSPKVTEQVKSQVRRSAMIVSPDTQRRCFLTCQNWEVKNARTGKRMTIHKGQLVFFSGFTEVRGIEVRFFHTMDGRIFMTSSPGENDIFLRPVFKESPLIWSNRV